MSDHQHRAAARPAIPARSARAGAARHQSVPQPGQPGQQQPLAVRRADPRPGPEGRRAHGRAGPHRAFAARLLPAGRHQRHRRHLRRRADARRRQLLDPPRRGAPARQADLSHGAVVPSRGAGLRARDRARRRRAGSGQADEHARAGGEVRRPAAEERAGDRDPAGHRRAEAGEPRGLFPAQGRERRAACTGSSRLRRCRTMR